MICLSWAPFGFAFSQLGVGQFCVNHDGGRVDFDDTGSPDQSHRPADGSFRPDMTDAEAGFDVGLGIHRDVRLHGQPASNREKSPTEDFSSSSRVP